MIFTEKVEHIGKGKIRESEQVPFDMAYATIPRAESDEGSDEGSESQGTSVQESVRSNALETRPGVSNTDEPDPEPESRPETVHVPQPVKPEPVAPEPIKSAPKQETPTPVPAPQHQSHHKPHRSATPDVPVKEATPQPTPSKTPVKSARRVSKTPVKRQSTVDEEFERIKKQLELDKLLEEQEAKVLKQKKEEEAILQKQRDAHEENLLKAQIEEGLAKKEEEEKAAAAEKEKEVSKELQRRESMRLNALLSKPMKCLKKLSNESEYKERYIWINTISNAFYWSKTNDANGKSKSISIETHITGVNIGRNREFPSFQIVLNQTKKSSNLKSSAKSIFICMDDMTTVEDICNVIVNIKNNKD